MDAAYRSVGAQRGAVARENKDAGKKNGNGAHLGFEEQMARLTATLEQQLAEFARLEAASELI